MINPRRTLVAFTAVAMSLALGALFAVPAQGGNIRSATTMLEPSAAGDTMRAIGSARITGQADSTCYVWSLPTDGTPTPLRRCYVGKREADTIYVIRPTTARPLTLSPFAYFKNKVSEAKNVSITVSPFNWPAPVVDSVKIDTLPQPDSVDVTMYRTDGTQKFEFNGATYMTEGDTLVAVAKAFKGGALVPRAWLERDPVRWSTVNVGGGGVLRVVPIDRHGNDTALVIAVSCGCKESGDTINPPTLRPTPGGALKYSVRSPHGGWGPVTPLPADPFRATP